MKGFVIDISDGSFSDHSNPIQILSHNIPNINSSMSKLFLTVLVCVLLSCASSLTITQGRPSVPPTPPVTVPYVDIAKYLGAWYEQAVIPYFFERNCIKTVATYSLNKNGSVRVEYFPMLFSNKCERNGKLVESVGHAVPEDSTNAKLKVEFIQTLDIGAQYWIVRLADDYSYSVISDPKYEYMWVLYREPHMPQALYDSIIASLKKDDFPVDKLRRTEQ